MIKTIKKIIFNILILILVIGIIILFMEIILRLFFPQNLNLTILDPEKIFNLRPEISSILKREEFVTHVQINSQGLRDNEYPLKKANNTVRIAFVGESFIFGFGIEINETVAKILEYKLNSRSKNKNYEAINFGVPAYGTEQEYILIKNDIIKYEPDIIILAFSPYDLKENIKFNLFGLKNNTLLKNPPQKITPILKLRNYISWHSHLYSLIYFSVIDNQKLRDFLIQIRLLNPPYKDPSIDFESLIYLNTENKDFDYAVNKTLLLLKEISKITDHNDINLIIFIIPLKEQTNQNKMSDYIKEKNLDEQKINSTKISEIIKTSMQKDNITIINPLEQFKKDNINNTLYYNIDIHWNRKGHELAASIIYERLINLGIVP